MWPFDAQTALSPTLSFPVFEQYMGFTKFDVMSISQVINYQWHTQEFCSGVVQQIQLRTEEKENGI